MVIFYGLLVCLCVGLSIALPTKSDSEAIHSFASDASQIIATNLLKSNIDIDGNQVHSPLGVASILAVLAEASAGETYDEFNQVFGYPKERAGLRESFKRILGKYQNREFATGPSFQTWLYIYRNYSAREEFKQLVRENYFVDVRDINRDEYDWSDPNTSLDLDSTTAGNSKDVIGFETLKRIKLDDDDDDNDHIGTTLSDSYGEEVVAKEASKFDRFVDDKQYVEKPVILEEIKQEQEKKKEEEKEEIKEKPLETKEEKSEKLEKPEKQEEPLAANEGEQKVEANKPEEIKKPAEDLIAKDKNKREDDLNIEENETVQVEEKLNKNYNEKEEVLEKIVVPIQEVLDSNEPEKVSIPLQKLESAVEAASKGAGEIILALESQLSSVRRAFGARSLFHKDDITSALSANSITGRELGDKTKMLLFNGLYYRGNWAKAFVEQPGAEDFFFVTAEDAMKTPMMHATGKYHIAEMEHLDAKALCLPYVNKKYAMLVIVPNQYEGLHSVIDKLQPSDFKFFKSHSQEKDLHISMPKFQVEETSRSESMLKSLGLKKLFSRQEADLSLFSDDNDLHVDEIVQFVNVRVDEGGSSENGLSAASTLARAAEFETLEINRPFLYFVMDCEEEFVIVSGKIYAPEIKDEEPITIEVEFEKA